MIMTWMNLGCLSLLLLTGADMPPPDFLAKVDARAKAHKGKVAVAVKHLDGGASYYLTADEPMPTASLIKLPVMVEVYQQAADGKVKLTDTVTLKDADKVPGSGILTNHFSGG